MKSMCKSSLYHFGVLSAVGETMYGRLRGPAFTRSEWTCHCGARGSFIPVRVGYVWTASTSRPAGEMETSAVKRVLGTLRSVS